jgi:hypothetical protein
MSKELDKKIKKLEKSHGKMLDVGDEIRIIGMEYADIRSRIEATDVLVDHVIHQLDEERKMRRINMYLALLILLLASIVVIGMSMGF